jgi:erythronate-4-phosphate dehydrogenase
MKVIIDNKIPYIEGIIEKLGGETPNEVVYVPGMKFTPEIVSDADALIIRTRTHCNRELLEGSKVKFIATATIGYDHIDTAYCKEAGITWTNAPGCNSGSVAQYIHSALLLLEKEKGFTLKGKCIGVVGVGNVGSKVCRVAQSLGMKVLMNDLPRADKEGDAMFTDLEIFARECDVITFHTPLNREGKYKTYHLADNAFFSSLGKKPIIINTSRGEVTETTALLSALDNKLISEAIIDVWEKEPAISLELLGKVFLGTPHIAGYSADGKANATRMSLESLCKFFGVDPAFDVQPPKPENPVIEASTEAEAYLQMYNPKRDSDALKANPELFEQLRGDYPLRREKEAYSFQIV